MSQLLKLNTRIWNCFEQSPWRLLGLPALLRSLFSHTPRSTTTPHRDSKIHTGSSLSEGSFRNCFPSCFEFSPWTSSSSMKRLHPSKLPLHSVPSTSTIKTWRGLVSCPTNKSLATDTSAWGELSLLPFFPAQFLPHNPARYSSPKEALITSLLQIHF